MTEEDIRAIISAKLNEIELFCKNASSVRKFNTSLVVEDCHCLNVSEASSSIIRLRSVCHNVASELYDDPVQTPLTWYFALKAFEAFFLRYGRYPGRLANVSSKCDASLYVCYYIF
jgi:hypothetical protein